MFNIKAVLFAILFACFETLQADDLIYSPFIGFGFSIDSFHYKEFDDDDVLLDREDGLLPQLQITGGIRSGNYTLAAQFHILSGTVDYDGQTQSGIPVKTDTETQINDLTIYLERQFVDYSMQPSLNLGIGQRVWDRDIQSTAIAQGVREKYIWPYWQIGAGLNVWKNTTSTLSVSANVGRSFNATLDVYLSGFDDARLHLPAADHISLSIPYVHTLTGGDQLIICPYWDRWDFAESDIQPLLQSGFFTGFAIQEPKSTTEVYGLSLSYQFN